MAFRKKKEDDVAQSVLDNPNSQISQAEIRENRGGKRSRRTPVSKKGLKTIKDKSPESRSGAEGDVMADDGEVPSNYQTNKDKFKTETARINTRKRKFRRKSGSEISSREDSLKKALDKDRSGSADTVFNSKEFQDIPTKDLRNMITKLKKRKEVE